MKFLTVNLQHQAWHLQWMYVYEHGQTPFVQFNSPVLHKACWNTLIYFLIAGAITGSCVIMALLHTSPWKPSPYALSHWKPEQRKQHCYTFDENMQKHLYFLSFSFFTSHLLLDQNFVSIHPPSKEKKKCLEAFSHENNTTAQFTVTHSSLITSKTLIGKIINQAPRQLTWCHGWPGWYLPCWGGSWVPRCRGFWKRFEDPCWEGSKLHYSPPLPDIGPAGRGIKDIWLFYCSAITIKTCQKTTLLHIKL